MIEHALVTFEQLSELSNESAYYQQQQNLNIRLRAIRDTALSLGAQGGLASESKKINSLLLMYKHKLDHIFDFNQLLIKDNVLPPVISDSNSSVNIGTGAKSVRIAGRTYKIIKQVKFVTGPPTWRDYLYFNYASPEMPNKILLPKDDNEKSLWKDNIVKGWAQGIKQAATIFKINLNKLTRDYAGMVLYKKLLTESLISPVYVDKTYKGITGDKNKITVDDWLLNIKKEPELQILSNNWEPVIGKVNE